MTQNRIQDYGTSVLSDNLKDLNNSFIGPAVLQGNFFTIENAALGRFRVNPGKAITGEGVIIAENEPKSLSISLTSNPVDYTIYYSHEDRDVSGGASATLTIDSGILTNEVIKGAVLGWLRYPGSGVDLASTHFIESPKFQIDSSRRTRENAQWLVPIKGERYLVTDTSGGTIDVTDVFDTGGSKPEMYVKFRNNNTATGDLTAIFPFKVSRPFGLLQVVLKTELNTTTGFNLIDSEGTSHILTTLPFTGSTPLSLRNVEIPRLAVQTPNSIVYIQMDISLLNNREIWLQAIGLNEYNLPI